jgi:hypothetical protein
MQIFDVHEPPSVEPPELLEVERPVSGNVNMNGFPLSFAGGGVEGASSCEDASWPDADPPSSAGNVASSPEEQAPQPLLAPLDPIETEPLLDPFPPELDEPWLWNP